jgi:hypothetical protein
MRARLALRGMDFLTTEAGNQIGATLGAVRQERTALALRGMDFLTTEAGDKIGATHGAVRQERTALALRGMDFLTTEAGNQTGATHGAVRQERTALALRGLSFMNVQAGDEIGATHSAVRKERFALARRAEEFLDVVAGERIPLTEKQLRAIEQARTRLEAVGEQLRLAAAAIAAEPGATAVYADLSDADFIGWVDAAHVDSAETLGVSPKEALVYVGQTYNQTVFGRPLGYTEYGSASVHHWAGIDFKVRRTPRAALTRADACCFVP